MFVTENGKFKICYSNTHIGDISSSLAGYSSPDMQEQRVHELVNDYKRVEYHTSYLSSLLKSIRLAHCFLCESPF